MYDNKATNKDNLSKHQSEHLGEGHSFQESGQWVTNEDSLIGHKKSIHKSIIANDVTMKHLGKIALPSIVNLYV